MFTKTQRQEQRKWFKEYKKTLSCLRCGEKDCIHFHHIEEKRYTVSKMLGRYSNNKIMEEVARTIPLCPNCHHKRHDMHEIED